MISIVVYSYSFTYSFSLTRSFSEPRMNRVNQASIRKRSTKGLFNFHLNQFFALYVFNTSSWYKVKLWFYHFYFLSLYLFQLLFVSIDFNFDLNHCRQSVAISFRHLHSFNPFVDNNAKIIYTLWLNNLNRSSFNLRL